MSSKPAATKADAQKQKGSGMYPIAAPADAGSWSPGDIEVQSYPKLKIGGQPVIYQAKCTFTFTGTKLVGTVTTNISGTDTITLNASDLGTTKLQNGENQVLRDGDSSDSTPGKSLYGNVVYISSSRKLKSG